MLLDKTIELTVKILERIDTDLEIRESTNPIHVEIDEETLEVIEHQDYPDEFDIVLTTDLAHESIKILLDILNPTPNIKMYLTNGKIRIFEVFMGEA